MRLLFLFLTLTGVAVLETSCMTNPTTATTPAAPDPDGGLKRIATALLDISNAVNAGEKAVITANQQKLISDADAISILTNVFQNINTAVSQTNGVLRTVSKLSPTDRGNIALIVDPILKQVSADLNGDVLIKISNPTVRAAVQTSLATAQATLSSIELILAPATPTATTTP